MVSHASADHAHLAGSCDVNDVWTEALKHLGNLGNVARECGIEAEIFF